MLLTLLKLSTCNENLVLALKFAQPHVTHFFQPRAPCGQHEPYHLPTSLSPQRPSPGAYRSNIQKKQGKNNSDAIPQCHHQTLRPEATTIPPVNCRLTSPSRMKTARATAVRSTKYNVQLSQSLARIVSELSEIVLHFCTLRGRWGRLLLVLWSRWLSVKEG